MNELENLLKEFIAEAREHLASVEDDILLLENQGSSFDPDVVARLFRAMHSIKGSSSFIELHQITKLSHTLENIFDYIRNGKLMPNEHLTEVLLSGVDRLKTLIDFPEQEATMDIRHELQQLQQLIDSPMIKAIPASEIVKQSEAAKKEEKDLASDASKPQSAQTSNITNHSPEKPSQPFQAFHIVINLVEECDQKGRCVPTLLRDLNQVGEIQNIRFSGIPKSFAFENSQPLLAEITLLTIIDDRDLFCQGLDISPIALDILNNQPEKTSIQWQNNESSPGLSSAKTTNSEPNTNTAINHNLNNSSQTTDKAAINNNQAQNGDHTESKVENNTISVDSKGIMPQNPATNKMPIINATIGTQNRHQNTTSDTPTKTTKDAVTVLDKGSSTLRIPVTLLDKLMNLASELVLVRNQNMQSAEKGDVDQLRTIAKKLNVVTSDLQTSIMQTRMQTLETIFARFPRLIRDLSKKLGKRAALTMVGQDVELDKNIIESIGDPLVHLIRNALDHGLEPPDERLANGKKETGNIKLRAFHRGGHVHIEVEDDGRGIDPERIRQHAIKKGIITANEAAMLTDTESLNLIFAPGFSTAESVSDVSGRGVGMDVVKTNFQQLGGIIEIRSVVNKGTAIIIKLPLTLTIIPALIVIVGQYRFAIPQFSINEVVWLYGNETRDKIKNINGKAVFQLRDKLIPLLRLSEILMAGEQKASQMAYLQRPLYVQHENKINDKPEQQNHRFGGSNHIFTIHKSIYIVVLSISEMQFGLIVDDVVDTEEIVIKSLHKQMKRCRIFSGTTVLGDGRIALILDIANLLATQTSDLSLGDYKAVSSVKAKEDRQSVVIFHIGGIETFAIPLFLIKHIEKIDIAQIQTTGNKRFLNYSGGILPLIYIDQAFDFADAKYLNSVYIFIIKAKNPIGIVVAEIVDVLEISSKVDTRSYVKPGIIGMTSIENKIVMVLDIFKMIEIVEPNWYQGSMPIDTRINKILLLEDTSFYASLIASYLKGMGLEVDIAENGEEGIRFVKKKHYDYIISDLEMPIMDGLAFARYIRSQEQYNNIPLIALSAKSEDEGRKLSLESGFDTFVSKLNQESMLDALKRVSKVE